MVLSKAISSGVVREAVSKMKGRKQSSGYHRESKPSTWVRMWTYCSRPAASIVVSVFESVLDVNL